MKSKINSFMAYVLCGFVVLFPWITWGTTRGISSDEENVYIQQLTESFDAFQVGKFYVLCFTAMVLLISMAVLVIKIVMDKGKQKAAEETFGTKELLWFCLFGFGFLLVLSTLLSDFPHVALWGNVNNPEGFYAVCGYLILFVAAAMAFQKEEAFALLKKAVLVVGFITIVLSFIEFYYRPISQILFPENWASDYKNMVSLTFYNSGYYGGFLLLLFPLVLETFVQAKNARTMLIGVVETVGLFVCVLFSRSTAAFYMTVVEFLMILLFYGLGRGHAIKETAWKMKTVLVLGSLCVVFFGDVLGGGLLREQFLGTSVNDTEAIHEAQFIQVTDISVENGLHLMVVNAAEKEVQLQVQLSGTEILFLDGNGEHVPMTQSQEGILLGGDFEGMEVTIANQALTLDLGYKEPIQFYMYEDNFYPMLSDGSLVSDITGTGLTGGDFIHAATGRGYIWISTLPLLKNVIFAGNGVGTFPLVYKQFDFVGLLNSQGTVNLFIDKPHNTYLQIAQQTGIISLVLVLILFLLLIGKAWNENIKLKKSNQRDKNYFALLVAVIAFLGIGMVNDSSITVNPLFWLTAGALYSRIQWQKPRSS